MSSNIRIEVNQDDVRQVLSKLDKIEKSPKHIRDAINRTTTQLLKMLRQGRKAGYVIQPGAFSSAITVHRATYSMLNALVNARDHPHSLLDEERYKVSTKGNIKAKVYKGALKKLGRSGREAFVATMRSGHTDIFHRTGEQGIQERLSRYVANHHTEKIDSFCGPSVSGMIKQIYNGKVGGQGNVSQRVQNRLHDEMQKEIAKLM